MGNGRVVKDKRPVNGRVGANRQELPDGRAPSEKLQDFMQAAASRVADPDGWKIWAQGEINKFMGTGAGLNEAKDETKAAVAAGWKALTDRPRVASRVYRSSVLRPSIDLFSNLGLPSGR